MRLPSSPLAQSGIFLAVAGLCALVSNGTATPARRLGWWEPPVVAEPIIRSADLPAPAPLAESLPVAPAPKPVAIAKRVPPAPPAPPDRFAADPAQPVREISPEDAWALYRAKASFLDARRSAEYAEGHIAGAWNVPVWEATAETLVTAFEASVKPGSSTPLVLYCSGGECEDSHLLAARVRP
jgi:rhodanese-related sulfurtransferase